MNRLGRVSLVVAFFTCIGLKQYIKLNVGTGSPLFEKLIDDRKATAVEDHKVRQDLPIMHSLSNGFNPVFVYSNAINTRKPAEKPSYSQAKQDTFVLALMDANDAKIKKSRGTASIRYVTSVESSSRFFVDLASNDALELSNTYLLEKHGWDGICLEPNPIYWYDLASYRTCTIVGAFVGGTQEGDGKEVDVRLGNGDTGATGGIVGRGMDNKWKKESDVKRNIVSIKTVFQQTNVPNMIDYLSLDVEGAETLVMDKFSWDLYTFKFLTIERPKDDLKNMLYLNGYQKVMDLSCWGETIWANEIEVLLTVAEIKGIVEDLGLAYGHCR